MDLSWVTEEGICLEVGMGLERLTYDCKTRQELELCCDATVVVGRCNK